MNRLLTIGFVLPLAGFSFGQDVFVPATAPTAAGGISFTGPYANATRLNQMLIHSSQLTSAIGQHITSIAFRNSATITTTWPSAPVTFSDYTIRLGNAVDPASRSFTFALNYTGSLTTVRSGPLTINANALPLLGSSFNWGEPIPITPTLYTGGNLLIEIRHQGFSGTSRAVDAVPTTGPGYLSQFATVWTSSLTSTAGTGGNFSVIKINAAPAAVTISGSIAFQDLTVPPTGRVVTVFVRSAGSTVNAVSSTVAVSSSGAYSVTSGLIPVGNVDVLFDAPPFLLRKKAAVNVPAAGATVTGQNVSLQNGDADNSGEVDAGDIDAVIAAFGASTGDPGYTILVDVDGSGEVDAGDIDVVIANFGGVDD